MTTQLTNKGYHINILNLTNEQIEKIKKDLTIIPTRLEATTAEIEASKFMIYKYSSNRLEIIVPRYYGIINFGVPQQEIFNPEEIDISFTKILRDKQLDICDRSIKYIKKYGGGLLSVPCGFGKTVCALYIASKLGLKTLIIVHKTVLVKQWIKSMFDFLDINESRIGIIQSNKCNVVGKDIVVGMIQTISKRQYLDEFNNFGFVIYDEAHTVGCKYYSNALLKTGSQYTLALTATPYRYDGTIKVMYWFLGGTIYREKKKINKNMIVKVINYKSSDTELFSYKMRWYKGLMRPDTGEMITNICQINTRNQNIIDTITYIRRSDPKRKIIILSSRISQLRILKLGVDKYIEEDINNGIININDINSCLYIGSTKQSQRIIAEETGDIIFATYDIASTGLDIKHLNTLIFASPKKDVMQSAGRISRTILGIGDLRPMIIDYMDDIDVINKWYNIRSSIYTTCKYEIEHYYLIDNVFKTRNEYETGTQLQLHYPNTYIHNIINDNIRDIIIWNDNIKIINSVNDKKIDLFDNKKLLQNVEYTELCDIYFVQLLTQKDMVIEIVKQIDINTGIDIDKDIAIDEQEHFNEVNVIQSMNTKTETKNAIFNIRIV
jgi:superfamily II DNA or RNA helicase